MPDKQYHEPLLTPVTQHDKPVPTPSKQHHEPVPLPATQNDESEAPVKQQQVCKPRFMSGSTSDPEACPELRYRRTIC